MQNSCNACNDVDNFDSVESAKQMNRMVWSDRSVDFEWAIKTNTRIDTHTRNGHKQVIEIVWKTPKTIANVSFFSFCFVFTFFYSLSVDKTESLKSDGKVFKDFFFIFRHENYGNFVR